MSTLSANLSHWLSTHRTREASGGQRAQQVALGPAHEDFGVVDETLRDRRMIHLGGFFVSSKRVKQNKLSFFGGWEG